MAYQDFFELDAWKLARQFRKEVPLVAAQFPKSEQFELKSQLVRAARSILSNIAEGHGRQSSKDEYHFLVMARGSLAECLNHLIEAFDSDYIDRDKLSDLKARYDETGRTLGGYMRYVKSKISLPRSKDEETGIEESEIGYTTDDITTNADLFEHLNQDYNEQSG